MYKIRDSSVGIATGYEMVGRGSIPGRGSFSPFHRVQIGPGAHPISYPMGTGDSFSGIKRPGHEADYSPPSSAVVKNGGAISPLPHMSSCHSA
jgi:hypothetical protein